MYTRSSRLFFWGRFVDLDTNSRCVGRIRARPETRLPSLRTLETVGRVTHDTTEVGTSLCIDQAYGYCSIIYSVILLLL